MSDTSDDLNPSSDIWPPSSVLEIAQQPLDIIKLNLRAERVAEAPAQFLENTARTLYVDFARYFHRRVVAVFVPAHRPPERIGVLLGARGPGAPGLPRAHARSRLHLLGEVLRAAPHGVERAPLGVDGGIRVAVAERALGVAHRLLGAAKGTLAAFARGLLPQLASLPPLALLPLLAPLPALAFAPRVLALPECAVPKLLLLANHVPDFVE